MTNSMRCLLAPALLIASAPAAGSNQTAIDKSAFHLFNPTPAEHLRELTIDGPGNPESPYTVDAGHFQLVQDTTIP